MGTEYRILKCPQFISYTEKQRLKIQNRGQNLKNTILNTRTKTQKIFRSIYEVRFKNRASLFFFLEGYNVMKMKIKEQQRSNRGLYKEIREKEKQKIEEKNGKKRKKGRKKIFFLIKKIIKIYENES